jgi:hypothetical protein
LTGTKTEITLPKITFTGMTSKPSRAVVRVSMSAFNAETVAERASTLGDISSNAQSSKVIAE